MPWSSILHSPVICPSCGGEIAYRAGQSTFLWGRSHVHYWGLGQEIKWLYDDEGVILPPYTGYRKRGWFGLRDLECNFGSPAYADVIAFDPEIDREPPESRTCPACETLYDHIAVMIQGGRLAGAKVFAAGELARTFGPLDPFPDIVLIRPNGTYEGRPEWKDIVIHEFRR